eukprot:TRINITY_DN5725_c0_g4_i2.p1 TRINITY_DN5725_c0_g4~~TRINITY_DN5725_c0_g4_i2.p1  ORF type:complete len:452 (-),score=55.59 TRINITY_DN5725_c0_g4_i2:81-1436(-)
MRSTLSRNDESKSNLRRSTTRQSDTNTNTSTFRQRTINNNQLWKRWDSTAQKSGVHKSVYWVKPKIESYEHKMMSKNSQPKFETGCVYSGDWQDNKKHGFGTQVWPNGNKYEGQWVAGRREGRGTFWIFDGAKLKKQYHGCWVADLKEGLGVFYYDNNDRYEGAWLHGQRHGQGTLFFANGDVYVGNWLDDKRCGWGTLTKANGDQFEGEWLNDKREGQGTYFYRATSKVYDGEWVNDIPKCGVYTAVQLPPEAMKHPLASLRQANQPVAAAPQTPADRILARAATRTAALPELKLVEPDNVIAEQIESIQKSRAAARSAPLVALEEIFAPEEMDGLRRMFSTADQEGRGFIKATDLRGLFEDLGISTTDADIAGLLNDLGKTAHDPISFADFAKALYVLQVSREQAEDDGANHYDFDEEVEEDPASAAIDFSGADDELGQLGAVPEQSDE